MYVHTHMFMSTVLVHTLRINGGDKNADAYSCILFIYIRIYVHIYMPFYIHTCI